MSINSIPDVQNLLTGDEAPSLVREGLPAQISHSLRSKLMQGQFLPGEKMKLRDLAKEFGVSPTPIREALVRLVCEGALEQIDNRSVRVPQMNGEILRETCHLRIDLEGRAAVRAAECATSEDIDLLSQLHELMQTARAEDNSARVIAANRAFHVALCRIGGGPVLNQLAESLWLRCGPVLRTIGQLGSIHPDEPHPHNDVIRGITNRDPVLARLALQQDITGFMEKALRNIDMVSSGLQE